MEQVQQLTIESSAGIAAGGKTGLTGIVVGILTIITAFFSPIIAVGFLLYPILKIARGKAKEVSLLLYVFAILFRCHLFL